VFTGVKVLGEFWLKEIKSDLFSLTLFQLQPGKKLERVAMLYNKDRLHFQLLDGESQRPCQMTLGEGFQVDRHKVSLLLSNLCLSHICQETTPQNGQK
jgi:hypothetical protein